MAFTSIYAKRMTPLSVYVCKYGQHEWIELSLVDIRFIKSTKDKGKEERMFHIHLTDSFHDCTMIGTEVYESGYTYMSLREEGDMSHTPYALLIHNL
jgi:hypothetical protein